MSDELAVGTDQYVPANALEGLMESWHLKASERDFDGTPEEYQASMEAYEDCREGVQKVIEHLAKEADEL